MKKFKLLMVSILACLLGISAFAQDFNSLFTKAKEFEQNKKYVHALGTYYDAIALGTDNQANEANASYKILISTIKNGQPGFGNFDEFTLYDSWVSLLTDAEQYWTEHAGEVYTINIGRATKGDVDYSSRTATYTIPVYIQVPFQKDMFTNKYFEITSTICEGLEKVYKSDWKDIPEPDFSNQVCGNGGDSSRYWPYASITKNNSLKETGIAIIEGYYGRSGIYLDSASWITGLPILYGSRGYNTDARASMINIIIEILDSNDKSLIKSQWFNVPFLDTDPLRETIYSKRHSLLTLKNVPQEIMSVLDSGTYSLRIVDAYLSYGQFLDKKSIPTDRNTSSEYLIKKLSSKKIPIEQLCLIQEKCDKFKQMQEKLIQAHLEEENRFFALFDHIKTINYKDINDGKNITKSFSIVNVSKNSFAKISENKYSQTVVNKLISSNQGKIKIQNNTFEILDYDFFLEYGHKLSMISKEASEEFEKYIRENGKNFKLKENAPLPYYYRTDCDSVFLLWREINLDE